MRLRVQSILQERQAPWEGDQHAIALVAFFVEHEGQCFAGCCRVKQTVGARYQDAPLEIGAPLAYEGPEANHERFRRIIEGVYRQGIAQLGLAPQFACNVVQVNAHSEEI